MKNTVYCCILFCILASSFGCRSYSRFAIDETPAVKVDSSLYGIWKAVEDTNKADYILVQSPYDIYDAMRRWNNMDTAGRLAYVREWSPGYSGPVDNISDAVVDAAYQRFLKENEHYYYITRMNNGGTNPLYQQWSAFFSKIKGVAFLNVPYHNTPLVNNNERGADEEGFFFVRFIKINKAYDTITTAIVADTSLLQLASTAQVRTRIADNINNTAFYSDTLHFHKVSGYHLSLRGSVKKANP